MVTTSLKHLWEYSPKARGLHHLMTALGKSRIDEERIAVSTLLDHLGLDSALWALRASTLTESELRALAVSFFSHVPAWKLALRDATGMETETICRALSLARDGRLDASESRRALRLARALRRRVVRRSWTSTGHQDELFPLVLVTTILTDIFAPLPRMAARTRMSDRLRRIALYCRGAACAARMVQELTAWKTWLGTQASDPSMAGPDLPPVRSDATATLIREAVRETLPHVAESLRERLWAAAFDAKEPYHDEERQAQEKILRGVLACEGDAHRWYESVRLID